MLIEGRVTEGKVHRYNAERDPTWAKVLILTAPCDECGGSGRYVHGDDCSYPKNEGPCDCCAEELRLDFCDVCGGKKRLPLADQRVTCIEYHPKKLGDPV